MIVRPFENGDLDKLGNLSFPTNFPIKNLNRALNTIVAVEDEQVIGLGQLNPTLELIMMQDKKRSKSGRAKILRAFMLEGLYLAYKAGYPQLEAFVEDDFAKILKKHYGFEDINGKAIVRGV